MIFAPYTNVGTWLKSIKGTIYGAHSPKDPIWGHNATKTQYGAGSDAESTLVCLCVYRKGAEEVVKRLQDLDDAQQWQDTNGPAWGYAGARSSLRTMITTV